MVSQGPGLRLLTVIERVSTRFVEEELPWEAESFPAVWEAFVDTFGSDLHGGLELFEQRPSKIARSLGLASEDPGLASHIVIAVVAGVAATVLRQGLEFDEVTLNTIIEHRILDLGPPAWLRQKLLRYVPPLLLEKLEVGVRKGKSHDPQKPYLVKVGAGQPKPCTEATIRRHVKRKYEILMNDTEKKIIVGGEEAGFRAHEGVLYLVLKCLLGHVGRSVPNQTVFAFTEPSRRQLLTKEKGRAVRRNLGQLKLALGRNNKLDSARIKELFVNDGHGRIKVAPDLYCCLITWNE